MRLEARFAVRLVLAGSAVLWAAALPLSAYAARRSDATPSASSIFALSVYQVGSIVCHQRPERSFHLAAVPLPVCARCTGIYAGAAIAAVIATIWMRADRSREMRQKPEPTTLLILAAIPAIVTLVYEWTSGDTPSNEIRASAGIVLGAGVVWILLRLE